MQAVLPQVTDCGRMFCLQRQQIALLTLLLGWMIQPA
jgi:hypothetical protein